VEHMFLGNQHCPHQETIVFVPGSAKGMVRSSPV
jgi:hypothetical protein